MAKGLSNHETKELMDILDSNRVFTDSSKMAGYGTDWSRIADSSSPAALVFPRTTEEVRQTVSWAASRGRPLVPSGGRTGMSGGASAIDKEVVVSLEKMNRILGVNTIDRILTCEAGCITAQVQRTAEKNGLLFPMNFGSAGSSHIGGNAATNAGGLNVIRYGLTRSWIAGLVVVTGRGEVLELNANLMKNATGYDLKQLFIGSEGTLGIITEVSVRLTVRPSSARVMLLALTGTAVILPVLSHLRTHLELTAFEVFPDAAIQAVSETSGLRHPFGDIRSDTYLLVEFETGDNGDEEALSCFQTLVNETLVDDGILAESSEDAKRLWSFRERIPESLAWRHPYRNDISVKPSQVPDFLIDIEEYLGSQKPKPGFIWYGHVGDGNVHLNILRPDSISVDDFKNLCVAIRTGIAHIVSQYRGSVSAEHGIGLLKKPILGFSRSEQEIEYMRGIKSVFDPAGIMNPGKIFD